MMNAPLLAEIKARMQESEFWLERTKVVDGHTISPLICPECGKPEAWAYTDKPFSIICNRANACGARIKTIELFQIARRVEERFPATAEDKIFPARQYLTIRGLEGAIEELPFEYWKDVRSTGSGAVMFPVADGVYNGRLFDPPQGEGKTHNRGASSGKFWKHPGRAYDPEQPTHITEGIIDALSLIEIGLQAIAVLSAGQDPAKLNLSAFGDLVTAFDNDEAGKKATKKWAEFAANLQEESHLKISHILSPVGLDWNNFILRHGDKAVNAFKEQLEDFRFNARLALAPSAEKYANIFIGHRKLPAGLFPIDGQYHYSFFKDTKDGPTPKLVRASNFTLKVEHFEINQTDEELPAYRYRLDVKPKKGRPVKITARGVDLKSPDGLTGFFLTHAKSLWKGDKGAGLALAEMIVNAKAPTVRAAQLTGFDHESDWFLFRHFAIDKTGKAVLPDSSGFYKTSSAQFARPPIHPSLNPTT